MEKQSCVSVSRDFLDVFALASKTNKTYFSIIVRAPSQGQKDKEYNKHIDFEFLQKSCRESFVSNKV